MEVLLTLEEVNYMADKEKKFKITLPGNPQSITSDESIIIIGANGSGKTRLGAWLEKHSPECSKVHRISAQKSLSMPDNSVLQTLENSQRELLLGSSNANEEHSVNQRDAYRWHEKPAVKPLDDFKSLMQYLFAEQSSVANSYYEQSKLVTDKVIVPLTKLDIIKQIWERLLPHRELIIESLQIKTKLKGNDAKAYNASEMSDGERVIFYLIGQSLAAPTNGIIIIDEPEMHIHKSIQYPLWNELEKRRKDCLFVYLTHDLDFAASRSGSKIWIKSFNGEDKWELEILSSQEELPDTMLLEILGNRRPIIFIEGKNGSIDLNLYRNIFRNYLVIPVGSCEQVIRSVKAFKLNQHLHQFEVFGIIDKDHRTEKEISSLEVENVFVLKVVELENLLSSREVIELISEYLKDDPSKNFDEISKRCFEELKKEKDDQINRYATNEIRYEVQSLLGVNTLSESDMKELLNKLVSRMDIEKIYKKHIFNVDNILVTKDYERLLTFYNRKSLLDITSKQLGMKRDAYCSLIIALAGDEYHLQMIEILKKYSGNLISKLGLQ